MAIQQLVLKSCVAAGMACALFGQPEPVRARVIHSFSGPDGTYPSGADLFGAVAGNIIRGADGDLYGTTEQGGTGGAPGTVFKLAPNGTLTVLHSFNGDDGSFPAGLRQDSATGDLYGVTVTGGNLDECDGGGSQGCGVIYRLAPDGTETVLHRFTQNDFYFPFGLRRDSAGNLYGVVNRGGSGNCGAVYELTARGKFKILHEFDTVHGCSPNSRLITDKQGDLYGTTSGGGSAGLGVVFRLAQLGAYTVLHEFDARKGGQLPVGVVRDDSGNIYGTTVLGGSGNGNRGNGVVFKLASDGKFTVLHTFAGYGTADGGGPGGDLVSTSDGMVYGTTGYGGAARQCSGNGCGTIFSVAPDGSFTTVYTFPKRAVGEGPNALLIDKGDPNIYGTTVIGGAYKCCGTVFKIRR